MTRWQQVLTIARWEFDRFVKWKQQIIGALLMLVTGGVAGGVGKWVAGARDKPVTVAVVDAGQLGYPLPEVPGITWLQAVGSATAPAAFGDSIAGTVLVTGPASIQVVVPRRAAWTERLGAAFTTARQGATYARLPIGAEDRAALGTPVTVEVRVAASRSSDGRAARLYAMAILGIGLLFLFSGFASLFTGITGEKQQRITEQMLSMVSPQSWMDGKILGLAGVALVGTAFLAATGWLGIRLFPLVLGRSLPSLPAVPTQGGTLVVIGVVVTLGTAMWFAFMAAVAATIDDPNSSPRTVLLMLPMVPVMFAFALVSRADSVVAQVLALVPVTSMAVLPVRLLMSSVPWWEPVVAVVLLIAATWWLRRMAGKIFAAGVMLYGKEPTMRDTLRWIRDA